MDIEPLNLLIGFVGGVLTTVFAAIVVERIRYRYQRKLRTKERLSPLLERTLGIVVRIIDNGTHARYLEPHLNQCLKSEKANEPPLVKEVKKAIFQQSYRCLLSMMKDANEFESIYSELLESGMLETIRIQDERLYRAVRSMHRCAETCSEEKVVSLEEALKLSPILVHNTVREAENCKKLLRKFIRG